MKVTHATTTAAEEIIEIQCNMCGGGIKKNELGYFDDFLDVSKTWGYHSAWDGETHDFDVCANCYQEWVGKCKIPVK